MFAGYPTFVIKTFVFGEEETHEDAGLPAVDPKSRKGVDDETLMVFVDSLGFLRLIFTPAYMQTAWKAPDPSPHLVIGGAHVLGALIAGALYTGLSERALFPWIFGIFALVNLMYLFDTRLPGGDAPLAMPLLYAIAVSLYTVVNFAIWADVSTPKTISLNVSLGVALSA